MQHKCPICKTPTDSAVHADFPFCSERCRLLDLGNWASEKYVVSEPVFDEQELLDGARKAVNDEDPDESHNPNETEH